MKILDGKMVANDISKSLAKRIEKSKINANIAIFQVGDMPESNKYISYKVKKANELNIGVQVFKLEETITNEQIKIFIDFTLKDFEGAIIQLPLPNHLNKQEILDTIPPQKDIDGLSTNAIVTPATPRGIIDLLNAYKINLFNKDVSVVGQSNLVGKPVADIVEKMGSKIVRRFTKEIGIKGTELSDVLIVAAGHPNLIKKENVKLGAYIIDVGINEIADENAMKKIIGDVDVESVKDVVAALSPVPGGVGPMTVISIFSNLLDLISN